MKGIGVCPRKTPSIWSVTGPMARASGVVRDLRKDEPYLAYKDLDFKVVCATEGDCFARYLVRMEEMLREHQDHPSGHRELAERARLMSIRAPRWCCPTRCPPIAASKS